MDQTKSRLLEAAGEEFAEKGFEVATIRAICRRQGQRGGGQLPFPRQGAALHPVRDRVHRCGMPEPLEDPAADRPAPDQLRFYVRTFLQRVLAIDSHDTWHHKLMLREMLRPTDASDTLVREVIRPHFQRLMAILREACPDVEETRLHAISFSIVGQCLHYKLARTISERLIGREALASLDLDYLTDHITNFSLAALGLGPPIGSTETLAACAGKRGDV